MAYATLRNLHVLAEVWMRHLRAPRLRAMLRYQLFVPVMIVGPINLMPSFERELALRRFHREDLAVGAERALIGLAMATVLISKGVLAIGFWAVALSYHLPPFAAEWLLSAVDWVRIYCVFAGLSSFAIGVARMMGIRIAENFDRPFVSRSLMEFWTRWHISLSNWCRDYVFRPLTAATRQPVLGLAAAMVAIGLWHDTSFYYIAWGLWQAAGIALNRMLIGQARRLRMTVPSRMAAVLGPLAVFAWLSLARPVVHLLARHGLAFLLH
jgi:alginate O-acetyltransferase complex protein AlgI